MKGEGGGQIDPTPPPPPEKTTLKKPSLKHKKRFSGAYVKQKYHFSIKL